VRAGIAGLAVVVWLGAAAAGGIHATSGCRVPRGESFVAARRGVIVWEDATTQETATGGVYACSSSHPARVTLLHARNGICASPTGCYDWNQWAYTTFRFAGSWVAVSAGFKSSDDKVAEWDWRTARGARLVARLDIRLHGLSLRADGALAFATREVNGGFGWVDELYACAGGCERIQRIDRFVEPSSYLGSKPLLSDVHFGAHGYLEWRERSRPRRARIGCVIRRG
jgi:hypothetical protein